MAMNKFMHPRNPYKKPPDFKKLALDYPEFRKHANQDLSGKVKLNFKDTGAVWSLTKALLHKDFGLDVEIIEGRLVPTLPLRMNYLLWIEDLISTYKRGSNGKTVGIDIGTGACCIYPLLAWKHFKWHMFASEVDSNNFQCAVNNVARNQLQHYIHVRKVLEGVYLGFINPDIEYDFCMCNPPFFGDNQESKQPRNKKRPAPRNAPTGTDVEVKTEGGEVSFVEAIINDSLKMPKIRICTVMLGRKSSLEVLKMYLRQQSGVSSVVSTMFCQGRTTRWGLAWTCDPHISFTGGESTVNHQKKQPTTFCQTVSLRDGGNGSFEFVLQKIKDFLFDLKITVVNDVNKEGIFVMSIAAQVNTWINSRRRRREEQKKLELANQEERTSTELNGKSCEQPNNNNLGDNPQRNSDEPCVKKVKLSPAKSYLVAHLAVKDLGPELELMMTFLSGTGGKDSAHQLLQCLKNKLSSIEF